MDGHAGVIRKVLVELPEIVIVQKVFILGNPYHFDTLKLLCCVAKVAVSGGTQLYERAPSLSFPDDLRSRSALGLSKAALMGSAYLPLMN